MTWCAAQVTTRSPSGPSSHVQLRARAFIRSRASSSVPCHTIADTPTTLAAAAGTRPDIGLETPVRCPYELPSRPLTRQSGYIHALGVFEHHALGAVRRRERDNRSNDPPQPGTRQRISIAREVQRRNQLLQQVEQLA